MILGRFIGRVLFRVCLGSTAVASTSAVETPMEETRFIDLRSVLSNTIEKGTRVKDPNRCEGVIGHHTATKAWSFKRDSDLHAFNQKWGIISYDKGVNWQGVIYLLKDPDILGYHASGWNRNSFAIVMLGNFSEVEPSQAMINGFKLALRTTFDEYDLHYFIAHTRAKMNRQGLYTECPGALNMEWLQKLEFDDRLYPSHIEGLPYEPEEEFRNPETYPL